MSLKILQRPLSYSQRLDNRGTEHVSLVVIHCTELPDLPKARQWGEKMTYPQSQTGNSGHFYIDRDGSVEEWVSVNLIAHHVRDFNQHSIGIELVNNGRYPNWFYANHQQMKEEYPPTQIQALITLLKQLAVQLPTLKEIAGHADLDTGILPSQDHAEIMIRRKLDPGPCFPWQEIMDNTSLKRLISG